MPQQALYLKWRPTDYDELIGQEHITRTLRNSLKADRIRHAYLFSGPRGTGKTTTARLLAKAVNCTHPDPDKRPCNECAVCAAINEGRFLDLVEIDAATHTGVDDVRDLRDKIAFRPGEGRYKVYIIDEVHRFTGNAFDALLKTLEEPPDHAIFVLATTEIEKVPATIKSRCLQFEFRRVSLKEVTDRLEKIARSEGLKIDRAALELIARQGTGSVRDSISLLDQIVSDPHEHITLEVARRILGTADMGAVKDVIEALAHEDVANGLRVIHQAIDTGSDPRQFGQQIVEHLRAILLTQTASPDLVEASQEEKSFYMQIAKMIDRAKLLKMVRIFNDAISDYKGGWQPQLALELALIESIRQPQPEPVVVQQVITQPTIVPQKSTPPPPEEPPATGTPPIIPKQKIANDWGELLKVLHRINKHAPAVLEYYRVYRVEGNTVYLATDNQLYFERLHNQSEKLAVIEVAFKTLYQKRLRVQVVMVSDINQIDRELDPKLKDPIAQEAVTLGGEVKPDAPKARKRIKKEDDEA
jgi:DNA polymerase-3 subunit gamma/tau